MTPESQNRDLNYSTKMTNNERSKYTKYKL